MGFNSGFKGLKHIGLESRKPTAVTCGDRLLVLFRTGADNEAY